MRTNHNCLGPAAAPASRSRGFGLRRLRRGTSIVEMSLTLMVLLYLTFGMLEFGYAFYLKNALQGAAREGARAAIVAGATNAKVTTAVSSYLTPAGLANCGYTITTTPTDITTSTTGNGITVTISVTWGTAGNGFRPLQLIPATKVISAAVTMRDEG
jgi:Flp pilus assembly protein TadG